MSDEQTLTGKIETIEGPKEGTDKNDNNYKRYVFTINGKKFSAYNPTYNIPINGDDVEVKYTVTGVYNNLTYLRILGPNDIVQSVSPPVVTPDVQEPTNPIPTPPIEDPVIKTTTPPKNSHTFEEEKSASIVAQVLIKATTEMIAHGVIEPGKMQGNLDSLVLAYKTTKQRLLE